MQGACHPILWDRAQTGLEVKQMHCWCESSKLSQLLVQFDCYQSHYEMGLSIMVPN